MRELNCPLTNRRIWYPMKNLQREALRETSIGVNFLRPGSSQYGLDIYLVGRQGSSVFELMKQSGPFQI